MTEVAFAGRLAIAAGRAEVCAALRDPEVLLRMIPGCTGERPVGPDRWTASIEKAAGRMTLRMTAHVSLEPVAEGARYVLRVEGRSLLAGSVRVRVELAVAECVGGIELMHDGTLIAQGLAGRLLRGHEGQIVRRSDQLFARLRDHVEAQASGSASGRGRVARVNAARSPSGD